MSAEVKRKKDKGGMPPVPSRKVAAPARHLRENGNPPTSSFRTPRSGDPESSVLLVEREALDVNAVREASTADGVRKNWRVLPLGEVVEILDSRRVPVNSAERAKRVGNVPYYGATGQVGVIDEHIFDEELVLLGEDGAPFLDAAKPKAYIIRGKSWVNNHAHVLRGKLGLLNSFLLYQLNSIDYRLFVSGTTRLKLPQGPMKRIPLLVPPENEQRQIVAEIEKQFTRLDAGVAALHRVQANLKRYRAAVLKAACEGRLIPGKSDWAKLPLKKLIGKIGQGWSPKCDTSRDASPGEWSVITTTAVQSMKYVDGQGKPLPSDLEPRPHLEIGPGDFLMTRKGPRKRAGVTCLVHATMPHLMVCDTVYRFRCDESLVEPRYLEVALNSPDVVKAIDQQKAGISESGVSLTHDKLRIVPIPVPSLTEQREIVAEVERCLSVAEELEAAVAAYLQRATRLRQSILRAVFVNRK